MVQETDEPPVGPEERLLRSYSNDPGEVRLVDGSDVLTKGAFRPNNNDTDGISLYRTSSPHDLERAAAVKALGRGDAKRIHGGVVAIKASRVREVGLSILRTRGALPLHVSLAEINVTDYKSTEGETAARTKEYIDNLLALNATHPEDYVIVIRSTPFPAKQPKV